MTNHQEKAAGVASTDGLTATSTINTETYFTPQPGICHSVSVTPSGVDQDASTADTPDVPVAPSTDPDADEDWGHDDIDALTRVCPKCGSQAEYPDCLCGHMFDGSILPASSGLVPEATGFAAIRPQPGDHSLSFDWGVTEEDRDFFGRRPGRSYRCRAATPHDVAVLGCPWAEDHLRQRRLFVIVRRDAAGWLARRYFRVDRVGGLWANALSIDEPAMDTLLASMFNRRGISAPVAAIDDFLKQHGWAP